MQHPAAEGNEPQQQVTLQSSCMPSQASSCNRALEALGAPVITCLRTIPSASFLQLSEAFLCLRPHGSGKYEDFGRQLRESGKLCAYYRKHTLALLLGARRTSAKSPQQRCFTSSFFLCKAGTLLLEPTYKI